ncbi:ankyrin-2 isoform X21 [Frankliniella occidentalis]|uniref:Ankyrin-2 isoform X21 n=1 Tax=Frankliniella occidentalis TaxID=133901 RepID=A0A9C6WW75_FRAOC|nr:ankyrin-2 isoform X21 [Frankliniella occidentalis]XP_052123796.1 ankyrin-2 isoform X21 [Frankliniella occidentalis]XP_052123797.1 ankyrin-2 isoform X21 [Frankliniella occidentalis]
MAQFVTSLQPSLADMSRTPHAGHPPHPHPPPHKGHGHEKEKEKIAQKMAKEQQQLQQQQQQAHSKHAAQAAAAASVPERVAEKSDGNTAFLRAARAGNLDKVLEHLKSDVDINTANANGLNALHLASKEGHTHVVTELLSRGATVDASTKKGNTALHIASLAGQEEVVRLLVQHGAAVNVQSQNGFTPLYMAAQENHDNVVKFLLANGANQSLATEDGFTPLAVAMQQGHDKVVAVLLENDTRGKVRLPALHIAAKKDDCKAAALLLQNEHNPDVTSKSGFTPLHIAAHYGNEAIANLLLNKGADVNYSAKHNISPLHVAAKWGKTNLVALLLERGAHIEAKTRDGLTPLHCAARSGHEQVVDMMLERGAPISCKTKNGLAPLHMAAQGDHVDAARILLYHRAPVDEITVDYLTALHVAAHCGHVRVAKLLLDRKADPNARALNGFTPLHIACKKNRIKVVELLLKHGASIEATTESGLTPLHVASFMGCMNIVIYLLQNEANPDVPTVRGETPLHLAARANQTDIIRILLRNGAQVDARAREQQTPLHIASRLGNVDIVMLLLQHGAAVDSTTKDLYTALHIAAKEGQEEVAAVLLENGASLTATTNKGCTPLHLAAKYGNMKVAKLLLQKDAPVDSQGKNGVTPLHVASHYDHQSVALLLLDKGASPHATAKNGHTPLHIAARKNQMDIATTLLEYGAKANAESRAGFTPLHLSAQEGHTDMSTLLIEHQADTNHQAKNGLTPLHLCAQEDRVNVAQILVKSGANVDSITKAGYTPLHVASHFGQVNMVRFLLQHGADTGAVTSVGYTPLHQAAQQGHSGVVSILLNSGAQPNVTTKQGQTALSIAQKLGYISVVETLKVVTEITTITTTTTTTIEEKYRVVAPETMQETFMSDSEEEGGDQGLECTGMYFGKPTHAQHVYLPYYEGQSLLKREDTLLNEQPYHYLTVDEMKSLGDDSLPIDVTQDDRHDSNRDLVSPQHVKEVYSAQLNYASDNVDISRHPVNVGKLKWKNFLVSFLVDARGGAMRGCRHSGVRVIVPPRKAPQPLRVTCRYLKRDKLSHPPPLMEGEALASRILELGPVGAKFLGPVIIEVPHFGSLRGREREIVILRSDNGETWREHTVEASEDAIHDVLNESFEKDGERNELSQLEVCDSGRLTRILTTDFPQYFAVVSRVRQEVHAIGPEGGMVSSSVVPQVQAVFPQGALTKKIKVGLQAQPIQADLVAKLLGNRVAVSPIVTVEPRRRKFHKPITLTIPVPQAANKGMINQYSGDAPTLRLLCSITGGTTRAQWEDVTGSTPLTFVNDCVSFTTTVSARFWLMDCRNISEATRMATELYKEAIHVPFLAKFVVFSKRVDFLEARLRVFCMTDDKEDKTLEHQEHFTEVAKSRDVEVLEGKSQFVEFAGNLVPVTKSGDQLQLGFRGFRENRLAFTTRVKDPHADAVGRILFMKEAKVQKGDPPQQPVCVLNIVLPDDIIPESSTAESTPQKYSHVHLSINGSSAPARPELRLSDISNTLGSDWESLAVELGLSRSDVDRIKSDHPASAAPQHAMAMLRLWLQKLGNKASGTELQQALQRLGRDDIIHRCMISCDDQEMNLTSSHLGLDQSGFDNLQEELGVSRDVSRDASREASLRRNLSLEAGGPYDEQDIMKVSRDSESVEELVEKPIHTIERIEEVKQIDKHHREQDDSEERKYVAEEKEVEEKRKSVRERTQDIEKRLSQTSMEDQQQRRDSQLFQGVSEGLERLNVTQATEAGDLLSPGVVQTPPPSPAELPYDAGEHNWHESKVSTTTTITSEQHSGSQVAVAAASPQEDEDLDADSFQEQFLLETPPSGITTRHGFIAVPDESDEEAVRTPSTPGAPQGASHSSRATSLLSSEKRDVAARIDKMQAMGVEFKQLESPGEEKGAADEKRAEHRKDVDRLAGGVGDDNPPTDSTTSDKSPRQSSRSTSPPAVCRVVQTPPTLELVIGHKKVRTRDASASSESTVTLYGSQDVEISIRSESHISVTRKEPGGKDSASASFDADVTEESESPLRRSARTGVDPQRSCAKVTYKDQSSPEHSSGIFILPSRKERKKEETVLFSGEESVYRYDQGEAIIASVDSPGTDESASHLITDTGISLTRGTTDTSPAQQPARGRADRDIDADIDGEESELTDAGLSPIQPDDIGLPPMSSDMKFYDEEVTLVSFTEMGTSPHDYQIESSSVALSPIEIPTSEASVYTDSVDTKDAGVSPIGSDDESLKQLSSISASAPVLPHDADLARSPEEDTESKRFKTELVIQIGPETSHSLPQKDPSPPKKIGPKVKELQKVFTEPDEGEDLKTAVQRTVDDDSDEESLRSHPGVSKIVEEIEDSLGTPKHARRSSSKDSPPRGASYDKISIDKVETEVTFSVMEDINKSIESDREELTVKVAGQSDGKRTVFVQETNLDNVSVHPITTKSQELQKTSKTTETPQAPQESNLHDRKIFEENVDEIIEREEVKQVVVKTTREETTEMENREDSSVLTFTVKTTAHEMNKVETVKETIAHVKTVTSHSEQQRQPFAQDLAATVSAMEKLRDTVENILPEFSSDHENRLTEKRDEGLPTGVETCLHKTEETLKRISEKLDVSGVPNEVSNQHHSIKTLAPDLLTAQTTLERIRKTLDDTELTAENTTVDNALTSDHAATATPEMSSPSAQVEEDSASTESSATLSAMELQKGATTHQENVGSLSTTSSIDGSHVVDVVRKEVCDPRPRSLQKEADHVVTERDVSDLMSEVAECTRQIKQEVRQLKPDLTPTPEGSDLGTLNLALARATGMSLIPEVSCSQTTELTIQHKEPDDHERLDSDLDGDTRPCSPPGERKVLSSEADLRVPSASTQDVDSVLETQAVADEKLDEGSEKVKSGKVEPATVLAIKATHDLLEAERKGRNIHTSEKSETDETIHVSSARADDGRTVESELRSALIVCVAVGQSMALDAVSKPSQEGEQLVDQSVECISDRSYAHLVKDEKDKVNDEIKVSGDRGEPSKYIMSIKSESKSLSEKIVTTKFDERMKSSENASSEIEDKEIKVVSLGKSPDVYTDKPITTPTAVDISVVDAKTTLKVTNDLLKSERACLHDFHPGLKTGLVLTDVSTIRDEKDPSVKIAVEDARLLADATKALDEEKNVKEEKVKQEITKAEAILSQGSSVKTDEQIIIEVEERLEKDIEMPAADSRESTPETRHKIRGKVKEAKKAVGGFFGSLMGRSRDSDSEQESDSGRSAIPKKSKKKKKGEKEMKNISEETVVTTQIRDELDSVGERNTDLLSTKHFLLNEKQSYHAEPDLKYVDEDDTHIDTETIESVTKSSEIALTDENELKQGQMGHKKKAGGFFGALRGKSKDGEEAKESTTKDTKLTETEAETDKTTLATTKAFLLNEQQMYQTDDILKIQSKPIVTEHQVADMAEIETEDKYLKGKIKGKGAKKVVGEFFGSLRSKGKDVSEETNDETKNKTDPDEINTEIEQDLQAFSEKRKTTDEPPKPKTDMLCKASNVNQIGDKSTLKQSEQTQLFLENEQKMYQTNKIDPIKKDTLQTEQIMAKGTELAEKQVKIRQEVDKAKATVAEAKEAVEESKEKAADTVSDIKDSVEHEKDEISKKGKSKVKEAKKAVGGFFGSLMGKGKDAAESVSDKVDESVREAKEAAEAAKTEVVEAKDSVASAAAEKADELEIKVQDTVTDVAAVVREGAEAIKDAVVGGAEKVGDAVDEVVSDGLKSLEAGADEAKATVAEAKEAVEESKEKAADTVSDIKDSAEHEKDEISKKGKCKAKDSLPMGQSEDTADSVSDIADKSPREAKEAAVSAKKEVVEVKDGVASTAAEKVDEVKIRVQDTVSDVAADIRMGAEAFVGAFVGEAEKVGEPSEGVAYERLTGLEAGADNAELTEIRIEAQDTVTYIGTDLKGLNDALVDEAEIVAVTDYRVVSDELKSLDAGVVEVKAFAAVAKGSVESSNENVAGTVLSEDSKRVLGGSNEGFIPLQSTAFQVGIESVVEMAVETLSDVLTDPEVINFTEPEIDLLLAADVGSEESDGNLKGKHSQETAFPVGGSFAQSDFDLTKQNSSSIVHEQVVEKSDGNLLFKEVAVILGHSSEEAVNPLNVGDSYRDSSFVAEDSEDTGYPISHDVTVDVVKAVAVETALTLTAPPVTGGDLFPIVAEESVMKKHTFSVGSPTKTLRTQVSDVPEESQVISQSSSDFDLELLAVQSALEQAPGVPVSSFELSGSDVSHTKLEEGIAHVSGDASNEPVCIQKVVHRASIDENFPDVDFSQFREVADDELHRQKSSISPPNLVSLRSARHTRDIASTESYPVEVEEMCVRRVVPELTSFEPSDVSEPIILDNQPLKTANPDMDAHAEASISILTDRFLVEERKLVEARPERVSHISSELLLERYSTLTGAFLSEERGTISKAPAGTNDKDMGEPQGEKENFASVQPGVDKPKLSDRSESHPRQVAAHEYDVNVFEKIATPISLSFSEPSQSFRSTEKVQVILSEVDNYCPPGEHPSITADLEKVSHCENLQSTKPLPVSQDIAQVDFKPESSDALSGSTKSHIIDPNDVSTAISQSSALEQYALRTTHITSLSEITSSNEAQSSIDSGNDLTCTKKSREVVNAPCIESVDLIESCDLSNAMKVETCVRGSASRGEQFDELRSGTVVESKHFTGGIAVCIDTTVEEVSSDVTDVSITTVSDAVETGSSFEITDTSNDRDSFTGGSERIVGGDSESFQMSQTLEIKHRASVEESSRSGVLQRISGGATAGIAEDNTFSTVSSEDFVERDYAVGDLLEQSALVTSQAESPNCDPPNNKEIERNDDMIEVSIDVPMSTEIEYELTAVEDLTDGNIRDDKELLALKTSKRRVEAVSSKMSRKVSTGSSTVSRTARAEKFQKLSSSTASGSVEGKYTNITRTSTSSTTSQRTVVDLPSKRSAQSKDQLSTSAMEPHISTSKVKSRGSLEIKKTEYQSPYRQTSAFNYMRSTVSRDAKRGKESQETIEKLSSSQKSSREGTPTKRVPLKQTTKSVSVTQSIQSGRSRHTTSEKDAQNTKMKQTHVQKSPRDNTPPRKYSTKQTAKLAGTSRPSSVSSTSSSTRRVSESSSASSTRSNTARSRSEYTAQPSSSASFKHTQRQSMTSKDAPHQKIYTASHTTSVRQTKYATKTSTSVTGVVLTEPSKIKRRERSAIPVSSSTKATTKPSKVPSNNVQKKTSQESVPSTITGEDFELTEPDSSSLIQDEAESLGILSPSGEAVSRRASSAPIPTSREPMLHSLHPRLQTSLPSSPSRLARAGNQGLVTQLLTSEVFTRTVESSEAVEVVYHQPERQRRPTEGEQSFIDTTDSSLSESTAIPSSSTSSDRRRSRSVSPKATKRSDVISTVDTADTTETIPRM